MKLTPADVVGRLASRRRAANQQPMRLLATPPRLCYQRVSHNRASAADGGTKRPPREANLSHADCRDSIAHAQAKCALAVECVWRRPHGQQMLAHKEVFVVVCAEVAL